MQPEKGTNEQRIVAGLLAASEVYKEEFFSKWAAAWISGKRRTDAVVRAIERRVEKIRTTIEKRSAEWWSLTSARDAVDAAGLYVLWQREPTPDEAAKRDVEGGIESACLIADAACLAAIQAKEGQERA